MFNLNFLRVRTRLLVSFGLVLVFTSAMTLVSLYGLSGQQDSIHQIVGRNYARVTLLNTMRDAVRFQATALRDVVMQEDIAFKKRETKLMREARKRYKVASEALAGQITEADLQESLRKIQVSEESVATLVSEVMEATLIEQHELAQEGVREKVRPKQQELLLAIDELLAKVEDDARRASDESEAQYKRTRLLVVALGISSVVAGIAVALLITAGIVGPLNRAVRMAESIAEGDGDVRISVCEA